MNRGFYPRLAWTGMKQNRRLYLPYLLTCTGVTAMFYILMGLSVSSVLPVSYTHLDVYKRQLLDVSDDLEIDGGAVRLSEVLK